MECKQSSNFFSKNEFSAKDETANMATWSKTFESAETI